MTTPRRRLARVDLALLALVASAVFLPGLGSRDLWNPDEPRYAEVAREMVSAGEFLVPHLNGRLYTQKPPFHFWVIAAAGRLRGAVDETAARLPSALAAIGAVLLVFALGRRLFDRRAAWFAAAIFGSCVKVLWQARSGQIDMHLTFWVTLAMYWWVRGYQEERPAFYWLFFAAGGVAVLTKGPAGLLPPLLAVIVFLALHREWGQIRRLRVGRGLLVAAALVFLWLLPASRRAGDGYLREMVVSQNVTRYTQPSSRSDFAGHVRPWYYYLTVLPADFLPWSFFLPTAVVLGWRRLRGRRRRGFLFALTWVVVTIAFFSLSAGKRSVYILTMYPGLALVVGGALDHLIQARRLYRRWLAVPSVLLCLVMGSIVVFVPLAAGHWPELAILGTDVPWRAAGMAGLLWVGSLVAIVAAAHGRIRLLVGALATGSAAMALSTFLWLLPRLEPFKSLRPLAETLAARMGPGDAYAMYPRLDPPVIYYSGRFARELRGPADLEAFLREPGRRWLVAERGSLDDLATLPRLVEVTRTPHRRGGTVLLRTVRDGG